MKIRPVILCGGAGTRLWDNNKKNQAKQFIDFGDWTLLGKTLKRVKGPLFDYPIISTNSKYLREIKKHLKKYNIKKYKILLETVKKNTGPAMLSSALVKDIPSQQPLIFLSADHLIEKFDKFNKTISSNRKKLSENNIFIFGIKPKSPSDQYGYFHTKRIKNVDRVSVFVEKPNISKAKKIIKKNGYWNSGMFFLRKDSIINNFKKYQYKIYDNCIQSIKKAKLKNNIYYLNNKSYKKNPSISFDNSILEKTEQINAIKLDIPWSDLGSWKEICSMYEKNKSLYKKKKNVFYRPWGKYTNLFRGKNFLIKELFVKPKGILSLQKHFHRSEHWLITQGKPKITLNKKSFVKGVNDVVYIPKGAVHRIENPFKRPVIIIEAQLGKILKESDIIRYQDVYGRVK